MVDKKLPIHLVLENLKNRINNIPLGNPQFADPRYQEIELSSKHFHPIETFDNNRAICYIDGGNIAIARAPNFVVELTRLHSCKYQGRERIRNVLPSRIEFYTVCCATLENDKIMYETEIIPVKDEWIKFLPNSKDLKFDSFDVTLMSGRQRASIDRVADSTRLFAEWSYTKYLIENELDKNDIVVKDGSLQTLVTNEAKYANKTYDKAIRKGVIFSGLSKTSSLFTTTGYPLLSSISELAENTNLKDESWYYHPIVDIVHPDHRAEMFAVKLHKNSEYVFRFEILRDQFLNMSSEDVDSVIGALALNSNDICFPGYPYGLIEADRFARISNQERGSHEIQFMSVSASSGFWASINRHLKCVNAHSMLDNLAGE